MSIGLVQQRGRKKNLAEIRMFCDASDTKRRVARWFVFKPKIQIWVNYGAPFNEKKLIYYIAIWNIFLPFGIFYGHWVI
jgi:hypothetical protein